MKTKPKNSSNALIKPIFGKRQSAKETERNLSSAKPTPLDFDTFIPWLCKEWQVPITVAVKRMYQDEYVQQENRRSIWTRSKTTKSIKFKHDDFESDTKMTTINTQLTSPNTSVAFATKSIDGDVVVPLIAYYDSRGNLVEISIIGSLEEVHRKIIQAINICVPFHSSLNKLTISKGGVSYLLLYEITKLLPHSNLTEVCLDNSYVPEGNYFVLLDHTSQLKCLSLNRCDINDVVCREIATRIDFEGPAYSSLLVLQLGSNLITDLGAQYLGDTLRRNRRLLHLNLSGNKIRDVGMKAIVKHLMEFQLTSTDRFDSMRRKMEYLKNKDKVFEKCMEEAIRRQKAEELSTTYLSKKGTSPKSSRKSRKNVISDEHSITQLVEALVKEIMGQYEDPFDTVNIVKKEGLYFALGNMVLCSLNLSYNKLTYASVKLLEAVLNYQSHVSKLNQATGLMRVVIDGNFIPKYCFKYERIGSNLKKVVNEHAPINYNWKLTQFAGRK